MHDAKAFRRAATPPPRRTPMVRVRGMVGDKKNVGTARPSAPAMNAVCLVARALFPQSEKTARPSNNEQAKKNVCDAIGEYHGARRKLLRRSWTRCSRLQVLGVPTEADSPFGGSPFEVLGVTPATPMAEARIMYRTLAFRYHPGGEQPNAWNFARVNWAWWILSDLERRALLHATGGSVARHLVPDTGRAAALRSPLMVGREWNPQEVYNRSLGFTWKVPGCADSPLTDRSKAFDPLDPTAAWGAAFLDRVQRVTYGPGRWRSAAALDRGLDEWGRRELGALDARLSPGTCRVIVLRHGMGNHNDLAGAVSHLNRDAHLNPVGRAEAALMHDVFAAVGVLDDVDLVIVSPFTRTLETAHIVMGDTAGCVNHVVQPLCGEHCFADAHMQRGDMGSHVDTLRSRFPRDEFPQFDGFGTIDAYCGERRIPEGQWWLHSATGSPETHSSFTERAAEFRRWLGNELSSRQVRLALLVAHGGLLTKAFKADEFCHCEFRVYDVESNGSAIHTATKTVVPVPSSPPGSPLLSRLSG
eukprot:Hpha_TRINITY_DN15334_c4_g1::TRINITY_DN15334_c4_g1_i1::g.90734::m.90734